MQSAKRGEIRRTADCIERKWLSIFTHIGITVQNVKLMMTFGLSVTRASSQTERRHVVTDR